MAEDVVEVEEEGEVLEEVDMVVMVDMMGMAVLETIKMMGTGTGAKVAGVEEEVGITMELAMKEAEEAEGMQEEATAALGEGSVAAEGEAWSKRITLKDACLIFYNRK